MNTFLLLIVLMKGICLFFCWKAISVAKKNTDNPKSNIEDIEVKELEKRMATVIEQNQRLTKELQGLKNKQSS
ncbi:hypothetical protein BKP45_15385 [Anaerobacillus alkalidiazotrophicus]|uniref:Uncharacterized protein n=1 Tax=Anaerobacillus alkalidiazotrophicus TaxID=472963 RepID=A0A1S2M2W1_9BACI|nr:hypothetical protein [Anaerobacillus alkalidiazotrophicus]OIJ18926.1 hypothetical protein BKP45_15385 [Anaerobacillus alkalidiazotrophicus]